MDTQHSPLKMATENHLSGHSHSGQLRLHLARERGVTLVELMVGMAIGLLVVAVAMGAVMVSRGVSGTVSDASSIQQQAAYAMRLFGQQLRQAGSMRLNLDPGVVATELKYMVPVAFEKEAGLAGDPFYYSASDPKQTINGSDSPTLLNVGFRRYAEPSFSSASEQSTARNCLGGPDDASSTDQRIESVFSFDSGSNSLLCRGNASSAQPVLRNVAGFHVRYLIQDSASTPGVPSIRTVDASAVSDWAQVQAAEICLVLFGNEIIDLPTGSTYTDCDGSTTVDMSALSGNRAKRMHMVFRNVFQLRSQGLIGTVLF